MNITRLQHLAGIITESTESGKYKKGDKVSHFDEKMSGTVVSCQMELYYDYGKEDGLQPKKLKPTDKVKTVKVPTCKVKWDDNKTSTLPEKDLRSSK